MKILVLQLTRPGDIFCTVPALTALRKAQPEAEIHFLVRRRFASAAGVVKLYDHLWALDAAKLLGDFIIGEKSISAGITRLANFVNQLKAEKFDRIINLSFTPSSSFLTHLISEAGKIAVVGYTRTSDFYLAIPDAASRYFKSQGGIEKSNRIHLVDLLTEVVGGDLNLADAPLLSPTSDKERSGVALHLGASQEQKTWPMTSWVAFLNRVIASPYSGEITLVGGKEDEQKAEILLSQVNSPRIRNRVGQTSWTELAEVFKSAELFVGADSGPLHLANLCGVPILNLSLGRVRFWETGPTVTESRVLRSIIPNQLMSDEVYFHFNDMLSKGHHYGSAFVCTNDNWVRYKDENHLQGDPDSWSVVSWMYFQHIKPQMSEDLILALKQIEEVADISLNQLDALESNPTKIEIIGVLDRLDDVLEILRKSIKPLAPLLDEYRTYKENIPQGTRQEIFYQTRQCYLNLKERVQGLLVNPINQIQKGNSHDSKNERTHLDLA